jgi:hypothetical protein
MVRPLSRRGKDVTLLRAQFALAAVPELPAGSAAAGAVLVKLVNGPRQAQG